MQKFLVYYIYYTVLNKLLNLCFLEFTSHAKRLVWNMEADKENVKRMQTKIPLPLEPLPALPQHLLNKNAEHDTQRRPLKTLAQTNIYPSSSKEDNKIEICNQKFIVKVDLKHVTVRKNSEKLDWDYDIFKDKSDDVISISDEENTESEESDKSINCLNQRLASTPTESPVYHKSVRNIKRSLKRPHSRELQGLSPPAQQDQSEDKVKRRLEFDGSVQERLQSPDFLKKSYTASLNRSYTTNILSYLMKVERILAPPHIPRITRACIINWLMKVNRFENPAVIQSACWYLDSFLGISNVQLDKLQVFAAACYWIAQKLHGPVPPAMKLVRCANHAFSTRKLLSAEKVVLLKLPVVPHEFITYLAWWCGIAHSAEVEMAATFLCMSGLMVESKLCEEYPSVLAAAAIRNAVLMLRKNDLMKRVQQCPMYKAAEVKAASFTYSCSVLRKAVRIMGCPTFEYKAPLDHYGLAPHYIAQKLISAAYQ